MAKWKPISVEHRSRQILRWLQERYPAPYQVKLRWVKELKDPKDPENPFYYAETYRLGQTIFIRMSRRHLRTYGQANETLIHEYAHARDTKHAHLEDRLQRPHHGPEWGIYYAEMYSDYYDDTGWSDSRDY